MDSWRAINIDASNKCTAECPKCLRQNLRSQGLKIPGEDMSMETFKKLANYYKGGVVICGQLSDPIFNDNLIEMLEFCRNKPWSTVHTAATSKKRKKDWYEKAFKANLKTEWTFGIDGMPHQSFIYRIGQDGEFLFEMAKFAKECGVEKVVWQYIVFKYNEDYIDEARKLAEENGIIFEINHSGRWHNEKDYDPYRPSPKHRIVSKHNRDHLKRKFIPKCIEGKIPVAISATQFLLPCCWIDKIEGWNDPIISKFFNESLNLKTNEVEDIVESVTWKEFKSLLINNPELAPELCKKQCTAKVDENPNRNRTRVND